MGHDSAYYHRGRIPAAQYFTTVPFGQNASDYGAVRGYVTAYDAETGQQLWRFYTVPGNPADGFENEAMAMAAKTWFGEWWKHGGGGTVWNSIAYDPDTDTLFLGTGNGYPWNRRARSAGQGDNLFLCSIVALNGTTGDYKWHYQINPGETWDYNAAMDVQLAELPIDQNGTPQRPPVIRSMTLLDELPNRRPSRDLTIGG